MRSFSGAEINSEFTIPVRAVTLRLRRVVPPAAPTRGLKEHELADDDRVSPTQLLRELYFNRTGIVFLLMVLVSVLMLVASAKTHGSASQFWLALGTATIATTGYSFVQVLLTTRQFDRFLAGTIQADIRKEIAKSAAEAMEFFRSRARYLPEVTYPAQSETSPTFNRDLNSSLSSSTRYVFRGMSARYAVARLALLETVPREVKLIVADPTRSAALDFRARHQAGSGDESAFRAAKQEILDGIYISIAGAYLVRHRFDNLEFYFTSMPNVDRVEICDNDIYITRFSDSSATGAQFPATAKFGHESLMYQMFSTDCNSLLSSPYLTRLLVPGDQAENAFVDRLKEMEIMTDEHWAKAKHSFTSFRRDMQSKLKP